MYSQTSVVIRPKAMYQANLAGAAQDIPVGRVGQPEDVAAVAGFLCSEAAGFVSGQVVYVAGGPKA